jgi:hypothetical protein
MKTNQDNPCNLKQKEDDPCGLLKSLARKQELLSQSLHDLYYLVNDAVEGRVKVPVGVGEIQVCVGHYIKSNPATGKQLLVPAYVTRRF